MTVMNALWEIQKIMESENSRISINIYNKGGPPTTVYGFVTGDTLSFSTGSSYTEIADMMGAAAGRLVDTVLQAIPSTAVRAGITSALAAIDGVNAVAALSGKGKTVAGSIKKWDGSVMQLPPIQLVFVALEPNDRPQDSANTLLSMCMPGKPFIGTQDDTDLFFWAPNGYSPVAVLENAVSGGLGYGGRINGTCSVKIGKWFEAFGLLPESAQFDASKETTKKGNPLYVTGSVQFVTYRDMKAVEYSQMFLKV